MAAIAVMTLSKTTPTPPAPPAGVVDSGAPTVLAGGNPVARLGDFITPHGNPHVQPLCVDVPFIAGPSPAPTVMVEGKPVATVATLCNCGHAILTGVPTVLVGA